MPDRVTLKQEAKSILRTNSPRVYLLTALYLIIKYVLGTLSTKLSYPGLTDELMEQLQRGIITQRIIDQILQTPSFFAQVVNVAIVLMTLLLGVGFTVLCMNFSRGLEAKAGDLFDGFGIFLKLLWLIVLQSIFIFLGSLLFVIPGIVAAYRYSMAVYLLIDDPSRTAMECLRMSKELTRRHKMELFVLDLSFLGWGFLCIIPIMSVYVSPYYRITHFRYYETLTRYNAPEWAPRI